MTADNLRLQQFLNRFLLSLPPATVLPPAGRQAAVLVPVIARPRPTLLLTRRASALRKHSGQVAFPGGMKDSCDSSLVQTALREAWEEVGIRPASVQVCGVLPAVSSSTGFQVTPVVGIVRPDHHWSASPGEVESFFEIPLELALCSERYIPLTVERAGLRRELWFSTFRDYLIWGMTAGLLRQLAQQVANPEKTV